MIVIEPVVLLPVFKVTSLSPFDLKIPASLPVPAETSPLINTVPSREFVMVSVFSKIIPPEVTLSFGIITEPLP